MSKQQWISENLKPGEIYAGILLGKDGAPDHHMILLPGTAESIKWPDAVEWAKKAGGELPTRREQSLLFANLKEEFEPRWHWSGEQYADYTGYAWHQDFNYGDQTSNRKSYEGRARAVRRLVIF